MTLRTTFRSRVLIASSVGLAFSEILFQNLVIGVVLSILVVLLIGEYSFLLIITRNPGRWFTLSNESSGKNTLYPGDLSSTNHVLTKRAIAGVMLSFEHPFLNIEPNFVPRSDHSKEIRIDFKTHFSGEYQVQKLALSVIGPLKLFFADCSLQFPCKFMVFPRVVQVATTSSRILGKIGRGDTPTNAKGLGTELYELRGYQYGDEYRQINWKATARLNELIVNERQKEVGGSYYLVLDSRIEEYSERDRLASAFLHIANTLTTLGMMFGVMVHDGETILALKKIDAPERSLAFSLSVALKMAKVSRTELPEALTPVASYVMKANQKMLIEGGYELLSEIENSGQISLRVLNIGEPMRELIAIMANNPSDTPVVLYFSALHGSMGQVIEAASQIRINHSGNFTLILPTMPWVTASDEEKAYKAYTEFHAKLKAFEVSHVDYMLGEPIMITKKLFESSN